MSDLALIDVLEVTGLDEALAAEVSDYLASQLTDLTYAVTRAEGLDALDKMSAQVDTEARDGRLSPAQAGSTYDVLAGTRLAVQAGELPPDQVPGFWRWLPQKVELLQGPLAPPLPEGIATLALSFMASHPPAPAPPPTRTVAKGPTAAQRVTARAARAVTNAQVSATAFTTAQARAVTAAIGAGTAKTLTATTTIIGDWFHPYGPGQVPAALHDLYRATTTLERQYARLRAEVGAKAGAHIAGQVSGMSETLATMAADVATLRAQLAGLEPSTIGDGLSNLRGAEEATHKAVTTVTEQAIPAIGAELAATTGTVTVLHHLVTTDLAPSVAAAAKTADASAAKLSLTTDECLAQLCDDQANLLDPIRAGGATPGLLSGLGNVLKRAFELGFAATVLEGVIGVLDFPMLAGAMASDMEAVAGWADASAGVITADLEGWGPWLTR